MRYLHAQRPAIVHRDLKTHNLLIDMGGRIKVCDFGLASARARMAGVCAQRLALPTPPCVTPPAAAAHPRRWRRRPDPGARCAGTPNYMAPELLRAHSTFSKSVDVYAFGVVAWEVAARKVPFDGLDPEDIVARVTAGERPELPRHACSHEVR